MMTQSKKLTYVIDIDNTVCTQTNDYALDYSAALPLYDRIRKINELYDDGNIIVMYTARGMGRSGGDPARAYYELFRLTDDQLKCWGLKYHCLQLGKPIADVYIDDKAISADDFFKEVK